MPISRISALSADWPQNINKEARKQKGKNALGRPQEGEIPGVSRFIKPVGKRVAVRPDLSMDARKDSHPGLLGLLTRVDTTQANFSGEGDDQFMPLDADQGPASKGANMVSKVGLKESRRIASNISREQARRIQQDIIDQILKSELTLRLRDVLQLCREVQRGLHSVLKASPGPERIEGNEDGYDDVRRDENHEENGWEAKKVDHETLKRARTLRAENTMGPKESVDPHK